MTDFMSALRSYLLACDTVTNLCGSSVYVLMLPNAEITGLKAHKAVVLMSSGGTLGSMRHTVSESRVDVVCYGETDWDAAAMERPVAEALKQCVRQVYNSCLLHGITVASGPYQARDPETFWPCMRRQIIVRADEREVG